jgi:ABC-type multidrug transport system ATPase subunit
VETIRTYDLAKYYGSVKALDGIDLDIREGEIFTILGPNGAGKTTFLLLLVLANTLTSFRERSTEIHYVSMDETKRNINITSTNKNIIKDSKKRLAKYIKPNEA